MEFGEDVFNTDRFIVKNIKNDEQIKKFLDKKEILKTIYIENKLINFIIKHDEKS